MNRTLATLLAASLALTSCGKSDEDDDDDDSSGACPEIDLGSQLGASLQSGDSSGGASNDYGYCGAPASSSGGGGGLWGGTGGSDTGGSAPGRGNDITFAWSAPYPGVFTVVSAGSEFDTMITVLQGGCGGAPLSCDDDGGSDLDSAATFTANTAGDQFIFILDGYGSGDDGRWTLGVVEGSGGSGPSDSGFGGTDGTGGGMDGSGGTGPNPP